MTTNSFEIVKKAIAEKRAQVTASPAAARKFLAQDGLLSVLQQKSYPTKKAVTTPPATFKKKAR